MLEEAVPRSELRVALRARVQLCDGSSHGAHAGVHPWMLLCGWRLRQKKYVDVVE